MSRRRKFSPAVLLAAALGLAWSQLRAAPTGDATARVEKLAEGVYAILHDDAILQWPSGATGWPHGNTGVVIGDEGVLVVDSTFLPSRARADIALIRSLTDKPVRYLVNTHWHMDHTSGNAVYAEAFAGLTLVSQRATGEHMAFWDVRWPRVETTSGSETRKEVQELEERLASGKDAQGAAISAESRALLERVIGQIRNELSELEAFRPGPSPHLVFDEELALDLGRRRVVLRNRGRANSPADITIFLPEERVLFTGDILVHPVPYAMGSYPVAWAQVLRELERLGAAVIVPGHGPVLRDPVYLRQVRELLETTTARTRALAVQGKTVEQIKKEIDLQDLRGRFVAGEDPTAMYFWDYSIKNALVERAYRCVAGSMC
jgi:cyclase